MSAVLDPSMNSSPAAPAVAAAAPAALVAEKRKRSERLANQGVSFAKGKSNSRAIALKVLPPILGLGFIVLVWQIVSANNSNFPSPIVTFTEAIRLFSDPFYSKGPNDQGIGWNILASLKRVGMGFGAAALIGIPLGFMIGRFKFLAGMFNPIISLLKPVSPLAWLPIGLLVFKSADPAAIWSIFICSIWPLIINTAVGVLASTAGLS